MITARLCSTVLLLCCAVRIDAAEPAQAPAAAAQPQANLAAALGAQWRQLPDWRGVWVLEGPLLFGGPENSMVPPGAQGQPRVVLGVEFQQGVPPGAYNLRIPYKPEIQKQYAAKVAAALASGAVDDPVENCWSPHGMPRLMGAGPGQVQFHVTPRSTWIIWDYMNQTRRIATDGSAHPEDEEWPRVMGHSVGKWEGRTLVIDTVWMKAGILDRSGAPHSDQLRLIERITRTDADTLSVDMTLTDPVMFTAPWRVTRRFKRSLENFENVRGTYCDLPETQVVKAAP
jgi:hypothetical protein